MSTKLKSAPRAKPTTKLAQSTDVQKVDMTRSLSTAIKQSSHYAAAPTVQAAVTGWNQLADTMSSNEASIGALRQQLHTLVAGQRVLRQKWDSARSHVVSAINVFCDGDVDMLHGFGFDATVRGGASAPAAAPTNITSVLGKLPGQALVRWIPDVKRRGSVVQHATDVANSATYSAPVVCTKRRYLLTGAQPASVVHVRIAAIDPSSPTGQSAYSEWISVTVR